MNINTTEQETHWISDIKAGLVVFLVALPLCLGIALASGAPLFSGLIAGIIGGILVGLLSGSSLSVSGPAAGLSAIVASAISDINHYESFLLAIVIAGFLQMILGKLKAGILGDFIPSSVIKGMLAAIGLILILKQIPHLIGYDADYEGDESFFQNDGENTFSEILKVVGFVQPLAILIGLFSLFIQLIWESKWMKSKKIYSIFPSPLLIVICGIIIAMIADKFFPNIALGKEYFVGIPTANSINEFMQFFAFPNLAAITNFTVWKYAITIAIIASLETLLSIEAADKLDEFKRVTPNNRELIAQGTGNVLSGLLGGIPITAVIVRSAANVNAGGKTKWSTIFHGILLLASVLFIPNLLNKIPLPALAAILIFVGFKLVQPSIFKDSYKLGRDQFIPFIVTIVAILFSDLLIGILIGTACSIFFILKSNYHTAILYVEDEGKHLIKLRNEVSFLNKVYLKNTLESIGKDSYLIIDASKSDYIDKDIVEVIHEFMQRAPLKNIEVELKLDRKKILLVNL